MAGVTHVGAQAKIAAATAVLTSVVILATVFLTALHSAIDQTKQIREQLRTHPPATAQDVDRLKTQVGTQVSGLQEDLTQGLADAKKALKPAAPTTVVVSPPPSKVVVVPASRPAPPPRRVAPTPTQTPTPKPANCLLGLVGPDCPKKGIS